VPDLAVITGTTHGIGRVTARELAGAGYAVVMLCRDLLAAHEVRDEILQKIPGASIDPITCDLASFASVRAAAAIVRERYGPIRLLINNAGITTMKHRLSVDGFELNFAINHLGPFLLTELLRERMAAPGRIINVASRVHLRGGLDLAGVRSVPRRFNSLAMYAQSKLANVLHTFALARRLAGTAVTANCLHPGVVASNLLPRWLRLIKPLISPQTFDVERGAETTLFLALDTSVARESGKYFDEFHMVRPALATAEDVALQEALWEASTRWVGLSAPSC